MPTDRPLRADASRNREAILRAAADAYARGGSEISFDEVAKLAGVGVGTVYRRFPTKDALLDALFEEGMTRYAEHAEAAARRAEEDPWGAFASHVHYLAERQSNDLAFSEVVRNPARGSEDFRDLHRRTLRASMKLVRLAKAAGAVRSDLQHSDLLLLTDAIHGVVVARQDVARPADAQRATRRLVELMLESFR
jgi:AcrR family transcriptional regulator